MSDRETDEGPREDGKSPFLDLPSLRSYADRVARERSSAGRHPGKAAPVPDTAIQTMDVRVGCSAGPQPSGIVPAPQVHDGEVPPPLASILSTLVLLIVGLCLAALPFVIASIYCAGPMAGAGAVVLALSQVWLFLPGGPQERLVPVAVVAFPVLGFALTLPLVATHWRFVRWPLLCQFGGLLLWFAGVGSHLQLR
jgi:hypothetical protein